jgi:hypothetical protein
VRKASIGFVFPEVNLSKQLFAARDRQSR